MAPKSLPKISKGASGRSIPQPRKSSLYNHMHIYKNTGRWGAWVREPKRGGKRIFLGTHSTERLAARCQDRALLKLETDPGMTLPIKLNFNRNDYAEDEELRSTMTRPEFIKQLKGESRAQYKKFKPTACLKNIWAEEQALGSLGNIPSSSNAGESPNSTSKSSDEESGEPSEYNEEKEPEVDEDDEEEELEVDEDDEEEMEADEDDFLQDEAPEDGPEVKSKDLQDAASDTAVVSYISVEPLASLASVDHGPVEFVQGWVGRRRRNRMASDDELDVADFLRDLGNGDFRNEELDAEGTLLAMKKDAPVYSSSHSSNSSPVTL